MDQGETTLIGRLSNLDTGFIHQNTKSFIRGGRILAYLSVCIFITNQRIYMKKLMCAFSMLLSLNSFALTKDELAECILNQNEHTQMLTSIMADEARAGRVFKAEYEKYISDILSPDVKTCRQASGIAAAKIGIVFMSTPSAGK